MLFQNNGFRGIDDGAEDKWPHGCNCYCRRIVSHGSLVDHGFEHDTIHLSVYRNHHAGQNEVIAFRQDRPSCVQGKAKSLPPAGMDAVSIQKQNCHQSIFYRMGCGEPDHIFLSQQQPDLIDRRHRVACCTDFCCDLRFQICLIPAVYGINTLEDERGAVDQNHPNRGGFIRIQCVCQRYNGNYGAEAGEKPHADARSDQQSVAVIPDQLIDQNSVDTQGTHGSEHGREGCGVVDQSVVGRSQIPGHQQ